MFCQSEPHWKKIWTLKRSPQSVYVMVYMCDGLLCLQNSNSRSVWQRQMTVIHNSPQKGGVNFAFFIFSLQVPLWSNIVTVDQDVLREEKGI